MAANICLVSTLFSLLLLATKLQAEEAVKTYELKRGNIKLRFTNYGATLDSVTLPDKHGKLADVSLGFDNPNDFKNDTVYFGNIVGRVANRIGGAQFQLNGKVYKLPANDGNNTLHGGTKGFGDVIWKVTKLVENSKHSYITFTYDSFDGEQGFPGELSVSVTYMILSKNTMAIKMTAAPHNKPTPVNLAYHGYWNLGGHNSGTILNHTIQLFSHKITPVDDHLIPTGSLTSVEGTPYDFLEPQQIGSRIDDLPKGYDINYVVDDLSPGRLKKAAVVKDHVSGRKLELWTNQPGVQFYTSNMLNDVKGKGGFTYQKYAGFCLETQGFPDSVNHQEFPSQIVNPGQSYVHYMVYRFTAS
ncbi:Galactose mutarotase [Linum grandiflorum]